MIHSFLIIKDCEIKIFLIYNVLYNHFFIYILTIYTLIFYKYLSLYKFLCLFFKEMLNACAENVTRKSVSPADVRSLKFPRVRALKSPKLYLDDFNNLTLNVFSMFSRFVVYLLKNNLYIAL